MKIMKTHWTLIVVAGVVLALAASAARGGYPELFKLTADDGADRDYFGGSVGIDGDIAIVGAETDDDAGLDSNSGSAYLFDVTTGLQLRKLTAFDAAIEDRFGCSVGISENVAIVGAGWDDVLGSDSGSAYLFDLVANNYIKLTALDGAAEDRFGWSVAISGNKAIVGAAFDDDAGTDSGSAYVFNVTTGSQLLELTDVDVAAYDWFGRRVAIDGNVAIVGADHDDDAGTDSGSAYLFDVTTGEKLFKLTASDAAAGDWFGTSVAISGDIAIVGARYDKDEAGEVMGSAYLFDVTTGAELFKLPGVGAFFGYSVGISGDIAIVGAYGGDSAYLFDVTTGLQLAELAAPDAAFDDEFGGSVAIYGNIAIVGAIKTDYMEVIDSGSVYLYEVPEPATMSLLALGGVAMLRKRRKA